MAGCRNSSMSGRGINERRCVPGSGSANFWLRSLELHAVALSETPPRCHPPHRRDRLPGAALTTNAETLRRTRQRIKMVVRRCLAHAFIDFNPAGEVISADGSGRGRYARMMDTLREFPPGAHRSRRSRRPSSHRPRNRRRWRALNPSAGRTWG